MTRSLFNPSIQREVSTNRFFGKDTRQRPFAGIWVYPVDDVDCPPLEFGTDQYGNTTQLWTPCLLNDWLQVDSDAVENLEMFAFRGHYDGSLEFKGHLDASGGATSGSVAFILPGMGDLEPDYVTLLDENQIWDTIITDDAGTTFQSAMVKIDADTGEVTITWPIS
jgi:hypothetical protein